MNVYRHDSVDELWELLYQRDHRANISHKWMPTYEQHTRFVYSKPYAAWYLIEGDFPPDARCAHSRPLIAGAIYLTRADEIGISLHKRFQRLGIGRMAVALLMEQHKRARYLANVSPNNKLSRNFFLKFGFKPLQVTYAYEPD